MTWVIITILQIKNKFTCKLQFKNIIQWMHRQCLQLQYHDINENIILRLSDYLFGLEKEGFTDPDCGCASRQLAVQQDVTGNRASG